MKEKIKQLSAKYLDEVIKIRRELHRNPELSFQEFQTAKFIAEKLQEYGIPYTEGVAGTGIVGIIKGDKEAGREGKVIALRAEMDALPIQEENVVEYKSVNQGVMHACGHDANVACLLGCGRILNELKRDFNGIIKLIFQPGEEKLPGGAKMMIEAGVLKEPTVSCIFAQHSLPELDAGKVGFRKGLYMASSDEIYLKIIGKGGHGAMPHQTIDPVLIASQIIVSLQQIVTRNAPPHIPTVLTFGKVIANGKVNIIPDEVSVEGTLRTFDERWRKEAHERIKSLATAIALGMGGKCEVEIKVGYPCVVNDNNLTEKARTWAIDYLGKENVVEMDIRMGADDFAYYGYEIPACYYRYGIKNEKKGITSNLHTSTFNIDEKALEIGTGLMAWIVVNC